MPLLDFAWAKAKEPFYVIGDIHGMAQHLRELLVKIREHAAKQGIACPTVVTVGDYVDRGPDSKGVLEQLSRPEGYRLIPIKGNHEALMMAFLGFERMPQASRWLTVGSSSTFSSFGITLAELEMDTAVKALRQAIQPYLPFLRSLQYCYRNGRYYVCHAGIRPGRPLFWQKTEDLLAIREPFLSYTGPLPKVIVHGHTGVAQVSYLPFRINVDTGACTSGVLSAVCLHPHGDKETIQVSHALNTIDT